LGLLEQPLQLRIRQLVPAFGNRVEATLLAFRLRLEGDPARVVEGREVILILDPRVEIVGHDIPRPPLSTFTIQELPYGHFVLELAPQKCTSRCVLDRSSSFSSDV